MMMNILSATKFKEENMQQVLIGELLKIAQKAQNDDLTFSKWRTDILVAYLIRKVELKFLELFSSSRISGTVHTCVGQELSGVAISKYLIEGDWITSNHRCHGHYIARTNDWRGLVDELLGDRHGVSSGIGSSQHLYKDNFISNGTQGSLLPVATGIAHSEKIRESGVIAVSFIGEGTLGEGVTYEAFNLSSIFSAPQLFVCENNYYSQTTEQASAIAGDILARPAAFGIQTFKTNTWDLNDLFETSKSAVEYVRTNKKPAFLKIDTYRLLAHSKGDDDRDPVEVDRFSRLDALNIIEAKSIFKDERDSIDLEIDEYVEGKLKNIELIDYTSYKKDELPRKQSSSFSNVNNELRTLVSALNEAYRKQLAEHDAFFIGEDIADPYGGAFKITKGFQDIKSENILSTSISEAGLVGFAIGLDLSGRSVFAEIMFGDFIVNAMDQIINNCSKFHHMYGKQFSSSVKIRTPMGGRRGYGPTHSQSLEKFVLGIDNLSVVATTSLADPNPLIKDVMELKCPAIIIENKTDYGSYLYQPKPGLELNKVGRKLSTLLLSPKTVQPDITVVAYGYIARLFADNYERIFEETDLIYELVCPQLLHPLPSSHIERSLKKTKRLLVLEETTEGFGWADGVVSHFAQNSVNNDYLVLSSDPVPIPSNRHTEEHNLLSVNEIISSVKAWLNV